nr:MAG TPA: hypothetical protein [Caudoviricetes sp.]
MPIAVPALITITPKWTVMAGLSVAHPKAGAMWMTCKPNNAKEKPSLLKRGFFVRKTVRKIEDKTSCVWYFYWRNGKYFYHSKKLNPLKYKENPTITRIVGLVRVAGVEPPNKWI